MLIKTKASLLEETICCPKLIKKRHQCKNCWRGKSYRMKITVPILITMRLLKRLLKLRKKGNCHLETVRELRQFSFSHRDSSYWHNLIVRREKHLKQAPGCTHDLKELVKNNKTSHRNRSVNYLIKVSKLIQIDLLLRRAKEARNAWAIKVARKRLYLCIKVEKLDQAISAPVRVWSKVPTNKALLGNLKKQIKMLNQFRWNLTKGLPKWDTRSNKVSRSS